MLTRFKEKFRKDEALSDVAGYPAPQGTSDASLRDFLRQFGGQSFNDGLYRVMSASVQDEADAFIAQALPGFAERTEAFAYDWLGRIFALDSDRMITGSRAVLMLEPGTSEALEIPCDLITFHEEALIRQAEAALAVRFHNEWLRRAGAAPAHNQCIGYIKPLFLGGSDTIDNLHLCELDAYWTLTAQIIHRVRNLPPGTPISSISLTD